MISYQFSISTFTTVFSKPRRHVLLLLILRSWLYSYVSCLIALTAFTIIDQGVSFIIHRETQFFLPIVGIIFLIGGILSIIPVGCGAVILACGVYWVTLMGWKTVNRGKIIGGVLGIILVLGISMFISALLVSIGKGSVIRLIVWTIEAAILGSIAGGWAGSRLVHWFDSERFVL